MITRVQLPQLELTMENAAVAGLLVKVGDIVATGQGLIEVETQKAISEVPSPVSGFVREFLVKPGDVVRAKATICLVTSAPDEPLADFSIDPLPTQALVPAALASAGEGVAAAREPGIRAAPAARKAARDLAVDLAQVAPTGAHGRITVEDVVAFAAARQSAQTAPTPSVLADGWEPLPRTRIALIGAMQKSLAEIPQIVISRQLDVTSLCASAPGTTFTHRLIAALIPALDAHPTLRAVTDGRRKRVLPVSIAVAIASAENLAAPVLRGPDLASLVTIAARLQEYRERTANRTLRNEELADGPFALTNLGMLGVDFFTPFVFPGQIAVLGVGRAFDAGNCRKFAWFCLAVDHRLVDGAEAARFLATLQEKIRA